MSRSSFTSDSALIEAFNAVIEDAIQADEVWYIVLMQSYQRYGGPEEGGWWATDSAPVAYKACPSKDIADKLAEAVKAKAKELTDEARREYCKRCERETEWLEARGLDDSYLGEPDGPSEYSVLVTREIPGVSRGPTHYE